MWTFARRSTLLALGLILAADVVHAGPSPSQKCASSQLKASGKGANGLLTCWAKAQAKGEAVESACLGKAVNALFTAFEKAEGKGGCVSTEDFPAVNAAVEAFVADVTTALATAGQSACASAKEKATGKKALRKLNCHAKAASAGGAVDPLCLAKAEDKFAGDFVKAEARGDCATTGDAAAIEALVDGLVATVLGIVQPAPTTTTTTPTTSSSTTTAAPTTTTTTTAPTTTSVPTTTTTTAPTTTTTTTSTTSTTAASTTTTTAAGSTTTSTSAPTTTTTTSSTTTTTAASTTSTTTSTTTTTTVATPVSFSSQVQPIFNASCAGCHDAGSPAGRLDLTAGTAYGQLVNVTSDDCAAYKRVLPGAPTSSYLIFKLQGSGPCYKGNSMPPGSPLPAAQIQTITNWILQGALNN